MVQVGNAVLSRWPITDRAARRLPATTGGGPVPLGAGHVRSVRLVGDRPLDGTWPSDHARVLAELYPQTGRAVDHAGEWNEEAG
jgi:hypothetical protein